MQIVGMNFQTHSWKHGIIQKIKRLRGKLICGLLTDGRIMKSLTLPMERNWNAGGIIFW
ncbi:MAG: hypothetical protein ACLTAF_20385 [Blautia coccoides]